MSGHTGHTNNLKTKDSVFFLKSCIKSSYSTFTSAPKLAVYPVTILMCTARKKASWLNCKKEKMHKTAWNTRQIIPTIVTSSRLRNAFLLMRIYITFCIKPYWLILFQHMFYHITLSYCSHGRFSESCGVALSTQLFLLSVAYFMCNLYRANN